MDSHRPALKERPAGAEQRKRRADLLERQKARRAAVLAGSRGVAAAPAAAAASTDAAVETAPHEEAEAPPASRMETERSPAPAPANRIAEVLMTAEWLVDVPADLGRCWYVAPRPAGKRCLVTTGGGATRAQGRGGRARTFPSALPGGSRLSKGGSAACELDCIWSETQQTYYVLDCVRWKEQLLVDCPAEFRAYWVATKLAEARAATRASTNPCRFVPLGWAECAGASLLAAYAPPPDAAADRDGDADMGDAGAGGGGAGGGGAGGGGAASSRDGLVFLHRDSLCAPAPAQASPHRPPVTCWFALSVPRSRPAGTRPGRARCSSRGPTPRAPPASTTTARRRWRRSCSARPRRLGGGGRRRSTRRSPLARSWRRRRRPPWTRAARSPQHALAPPRRRRPWTAAAAAGRRWQESRRWGWSCEVLAACRSRA